MTQQPEETITEPIPFDPPVDEAKTKADEPEPITVVNVFYGFAGSGMAGENVNVCGVCSALVKDSGTENHTKWHLNGAV